MVTEASARVTSKTVIALLMFETLALFARSLLELELDSRGVTGRLGNALSYLVVPVILAFFCGPILREHWPFLRAGFSPGALRIRVVLACIAAGFLLRIAWWCGVVVSIAFGWVPDPGTGVVMPPRFYVQCEPPSVLLAHGLALVVLAPVIEETINRGFLLQAFLRHGVVTATVASSGLFAMFHGTGSMPMAFLFGLLAAPLAIRSASLWPPTIVHMTFNGLIIADWLCLRGVWAPPNTTDSPMLLTGSLGLLLFGACVAGCIGLLRAVTPGSEPTPAHPPAA